MAPKGSKAAIHIDSESLTEVTVRVGGPPNSESAGDKASDAGPGESGVDIHVEGEDKTETKGYMGKNAQAGSSKDRKEHHSDSHILPLSEPEGLRDGHNDWVEIPMTVDHGDTASPGMIPSCPLSPSPRKSPSAPSALTDGESSSGAVAMLDREWSMTKRAGKAFHVPSCGI